MSDEAAPLLEARGVAKHYGPVLALRSADLSVSPGEVHALLGANGAGKSTLVKCLTGVIRPDAGTISVAGRKARPRSPTHAARLGLSPEGGALTQEFTLMPGKCYTILGQGLPPVAELDMQLLAKPLMPSLPPAVLAADQTQGPSASIGSGKNCYKNPFPVAAPVILTLKASKGGGPAGAQVYSK